jgi:hypothetical protein
VSLIVPNALAEEKLGEVLRNHSTVARCIVQERHDSPEEAASVRIVAALATDCRDSRHPNLIFSERRPVTTFRLV